MGHAHHYVQRFSGHMTLFDRIQLKVSRLNDIAIKSLKNLQDMFACGNLGIEVDWLKLEI